MKHLFTILIKENAWPADEDEAIGSLSEGAADNTRRAVR
jgi:hypothetical protein